MAILVQLIADYAPWIYGACALVALRYLWIVYQARRERREAVFSLERETAFNRIYNAYIVAFVLLAIMGVVYFISTYLTEAVEPLVEQVMTPTPSVLLLPTPTPTPQPPTPTPTTTPTRRPRPTRRPPPETPTPATPPVVPPACPDPRAQLIEPGVNAIVNGPVTVVGTANVENFQYYKLEFGPGTNPQQWSFVLSREQPVVNSTLGVWDSNTVPSGIYTLRLVVVDQTGNYPEPCQVQVQVQH